MWYTYKTDEKNGTGLRRQNYSIIIDCKLTTKRTVKTHVIGSLVQTEDVVRQLIYFPCYTKDFFHWHPGIETNEKIKDYFRTYFV